MNPREELRRRSDRDLCWVCCTPVGARAFCRLHFKEYICSPIADIHVWAFEHPEFYGGIELPLEVTQ